VGQALSPANRELSFGLVRSQPFRVADSSILFYSGLEIHCRRTFCYRGMFWELLA